MGSRDTKSPLAIGFLTVVEHETYGLFGGYLVLNGGGRPLEFHCTAPVKPNRAQEILYGPTLLPFLYGEQIGLTLVNKASLQPLLICTDVPPALALREHVSQPVALVVGEAARGSGSRETSEGTSDKSQNSHELCDGTASEPVFRLDQAQRHEPLAIFQVGRNRLAVETKRGHDQPTIATQLAEIAEHFDLAEPFGRIRGAIEEAQRGGK